MALQDNERRFEEDIETYLLSKGGYTKGSMSGYDKEKAINMNELLSFIQVTQAKAWQRFQIIYKEKSEEQFYKRLNQEINTHGLLYVLRNGIKDRGVRFFIVAFRPENSISEEITKDYEANIVTCTRQFTYSAHNQNSIDMVLSINGIPVVALELKNQIKGQSVQNAKIQFMEDRDPRETCFQFNKRFLVNFAVDLYEVWMTTKLNGKKTYFLPFNQGSNGAGNVGGKGNPQNPNGYATSYLWEEILPKDNLFDIIQRFMNLTEKNVLIFPRYHQWHAVTKLVDNVKKRGAGENYLIQHSAGSGKSNSIAWLAYHLASAHDKDNQAIFSSVIVVTDRTILDRQLQNTISSFDHTEGLVETISDNKSSKDLKDAIEDGKKIIITTLQKFPVIYDQVERSNGKRYAVIVDEAHSSQSGESAQKLKAALADKEEALREFAEIDEMYEEGQLDDQDQLVQELLAHGRHSNLSFFAFTATPKEKTLEMFGERQKDGTFKAFHTYSMHQAIEEEFILDVLQNYMTYEVSYKIAKQIEENPEVNKSSAVKAIKRYESLHPWNINQKTAIMIEQFRSITQHAIGGKGKAMLVTSSRLHAVEYFKSFKHYIEEKQYTDMDVLVAFSGSVPQEDDDEVTEVKLNKTKDGKPIQENQLKDYFNSAEFNVLIVAEKYQTGFDEPLLHTMFVDKKLKGVKAVQTLSRVNRTCAGKTDTFILDFVNTAEEIRAAFQPFYQGTKLNKEIDVNLVYDTSEKLKKYHVYKKTDIHSVMKIYQAGNKQDATTLGILSSAFKPIIERYEELDENKRYEFR
ncbi:DEAD/DEAH box helicase family protein, partial [Priestia megaterium]|uniref:type I restriction endonuclease subunit R n=1 Tax=Priestia megaterium TaxID=1404 RepID=UPI003000461C